MGWASMELGPTGGGNPVYLPEDFFSTYLPMFEIGADPVQRPVCKAGIRAFHFRSLFRSNLNRSFLRSAAQVVEERFRNLTLCSQTSREITLSSQAFRNLTPRHANSSIRGFSTLFHDLVIFFYNLLLQTN
jgi:hypothetical protein